MHDKILESDRNMQLKPLLLSITHIYQPILMFKLLLHIYPVFQTQWEIEYLLKWANAPFPTSIMQCSIPSTLIEKMTLQTFLLLTIWLHIKLLQSTSWGWDWSKIWAFAQHLSISSKLLMLSNWVYAQTSANAQIRAYTQITVYAHNPNHQIKWALALSITDSHLRRA